MNDQKNFIEGRMEVDLGWLFVGSGLELNWWRCGCWGVPPHSNLGFFLMFTVGGKVGHLIAPAVGVEWPKEFYRR